MNSRYWDIMSWAHKQKCGGPGPKGVLIYLATRADDWGMCFPPLDMMAVETEMNERSVRRHLLKLDELKLLKKIRRRRQNGSWKSDLFVLRWAALDQIIGYIQKSEKNAPDHVIGALDDLKVLSESETKEEQPVDKLSGGEIEGNQGENGDKITSKSDGLPVDTVTSGQIDHRTKSTQKPDTVSTLEQPVTTNNTPKVPTGDCSSDLIDLNDYQKLSDVPVQHPIGALYTAYDHENSLRADKVMPEWRPSAEEYQQLVEAFNCQLDGVKVAAMDFAKFFSGDNGRIKRRMVKSPMQAFMRWLWKRRTDLHGRPKGFNTSSQADWRRFLGDVNGKFAPQHRKGNWHYPGMTPREIGPNPWERYNPQMPIDIHSEYGARWGWVAVPQEILERMGS